MWDIEKLDQEGYDRMREAYEMNNIKELMKIHNSYKLSKTIYCCPGQTESLLLWVIHVIDNWKK